MRRSALSPRAAAGAFEDLASRGRLIGRQRVDRSRLRRRVARRARVIAGRAGLVALVVVALGVSGLLAGWLLKSPRFAVSSVEVSGQSRLTREAIETAAAIAPGSNIFTLDTREVVARLEALPLVRHAAVIRSLPNRVAIAVEERRPFTLVHAGRCTGSTSRGSTSGPRRGPSPSARPSSAASARTIWSPMRPAVAPPPGSACCGFSCARGKAC